MGVVLLFVLAVLGAFTGIGWFLGARSVRRSSSRPRDVPPPAAVYEEGYDAGYRAGLQARELQAVPGARDVGSGSVQSGHPPSAVLPPSSTGGFPTSSADDGAPAPAGRPAPPAVAGEGGPAPSPAEQAATKAARDLRSINIALYSASLLLVAAAGLFIGAAVPGPARAVTICAVVAVFYLGGLVLHSRLPRLRPAAVAFTGTGLALLPVAGLLFGVLTGEGPSAWFGTAVLGTVAYLLAAVRLQSRVVAYLSLPFFLSIALSSVSLIGGALIWYFTCSVGVAALLAVLAHPAPRWMPEILTRAVLDAHRVLTPLALGASLLLGGVLGPGERALLWVVASVYYASLLVFVPVRRIEHLYAGRLVVVVAIVLVAAALDLPFAWAALVPALGLALQVAAALVLSAPLRRLLTPGTAASDTNPVRTDSTPTSPAIGPPPVGEMAAEERGAARYRWDVLVTFALTAITALAAVVVIGWSRGAGWGDRPDVLVPVLLVLLLGMWVAVHLRGAAEASVLPGLLLGTTTPGETPWRTELVVALIVGFLVVRARTSTGGLREKFLLAARAGGVLLAPLMVLVHLRAPELTGGRLGEPAVLALVLAAVVNQLAEVVRVRRARGTAHSPWVIAASSGVSLVATVVLATAAGAGPVAAVAIWSTVAAGVLTTLALPLADEGTALRPPSPAGAPGIPGSAAGGAAGEVEDPSARPADRSGPPAGRQYGIGTRSAVLRARDVGGIAPVSLLAAALACAVAGSGYRSYEVLLIAVVLHAGLTARRSIDHRRRGGYLLTAQIAFTVLPALVSADLDPDVHQVLTVVAGGIALQEIVRVILRRRLRDLGLQSSSVWLSTAVLAALPLVYGVLAGPTVRLGVIVAHLALLLVVSVVLFAVQRRDSAAYPALYALAAVIAVLSGAVDTAPAGWLVRAPLAPEGGALVAAACLLVLVALRLRPAGERHGPPIHGGAALFALEACILAFPDGGWDRVLVTAAVAGAGFALSRREAIAWLDAAAALAVVVLSAAFVEEVTRGAGGPPGSAVLRLLLGAVLAAVLLYLARQLLPAGDRHELRHRILGTAALSWAAAAALTAMVPDQEAVAGSVVLGTVALLALREVPAAVRPAAAEAVFLVLVAAVQRITWVVSDGIGLFWAAQWWAVAFAVLAASSFLRGAAGRGSVRLAASGTVLSCTGLLTVVGGSAGAQVWSLCGHVLLLAAGVALSRRLFSAWGAVGIVLALVWFLRGYTFLLLTVAALALLAFAVWKLNGQTRGPAS
ncbi:hypothetical protein AC792_03425 [Arthrobacter sp. RIT-PI-e]|nr:hypothetical protein AC792_03425 [Arthrobacter sp. RIT-PI-e]